MAGISSVGVGSGLDLESLIQKLITAEKTPTLTRLAAKEANVQGNISAFGGLKSVLDKFKTSLAGLKDPAALQPRTATSSDTTLFSVTASNSAVAGQYTIQVLDLAKAHKLTSGDFTAPTDTVGSGTITFTVGTSSFNVTQTAGQTLDDLRKSINSATGNTGVAASLLTVDNGAGGTVTKLVLTATKTGASGAISVSVADDDLANTDNAGLSRFFYDGTGASQLTQLTQAKDARITVDGFTAYSSTNVFANVITGVTITALREPTDPLNPDSRTLTIGLNKTAVATKIQDFVKAYNEVVTTISQVSGYDAAKKVAGPLNGDATVRTVASRLRSILTDTFSGTAKIHSLADLGIATQRDGTLLVDGTKLTAALEAGFDDVSTVFASSNGVATQLDSTLGSLLGSGGAFRTRTEGFDKQLKDIANQREELADRLDTLEKQYRARFTALDALVARLQSTGTFLTAQLENTSKIIGGTPGDRNN